MGNMGQSDSKERDPNEDFNMRQKRQQSLKAASRLQQEYEALKEGKERVSVKELRRSEIKGGNDRRQTMAIDEKIKQTFPEEQEISFPDFLKWKMESGTGDDLTEIWSELFQFIDDDDGQPTAKELVLVEESLGVTISEAEAAEIIGRYDTDGNNLLNLEEFIFYKNS